LVNKIEGSITLHNLLKTFVEVDPVRGIVYPDYDGELWFNQFMPVRRVVNNEAKHVDLREKRRQHFHVRDIYQAVINTLKK